MYETLDLRDNGPTSFQGNSVDRAVQNVELIRGPAMTASQLDLDPGTHLARIDQLVIRLDGMLDKRDLGANVLLGVSMARGHAVVWIIAREAKCSTSDCVVPVRSFVC